MSVALLFTSNILVTSFGQNFPSDLEFSPLSWFIKNVIA
jgi:hypothetical protein